MILFDKRRNMELEEAMESKGYLRGSHVLTLPSLLATLAALAARLA